MFRDAFRGGRVGSIRRGHTRLFAPVLKNRRNRLAQVRETVVTSLALTVGSGHFGAVRDIPRAVLLHDGSELVVH